jgi:hypothetical protein
MVYEMRTERRVKELGAIDQQSGCGLNKNRNSIITLTRYNCVIQTTPSINYENLTKFLSFYFQSVLPLNQVAIAATARCYTRAVG